MWDTHELSLNEHTGVLLQYAQFWFFCASVYYSCSRYTYSSHSVAYLQYATCSEGIASWLPQMSMSKDYVQRRTSVSLLWDTFFMGDRQNTSCLGFGKGLRFLNMVVTFVLHPLSHYNSITKPRARFLLSLIDDLTIDFPSYFILSHMDVYRDTTTHDKLIFPSAITRIIHHASISYPESAYFTIMGAINVVFVRWSEAQLQLKWPRTKTVTPPAYSAPSTSASSFSSAGGVTLEVVMMQLKHMNACLDTLTNRPNTNWPLVTN